MNVSSLHEVFLFEFASRCVNIGTGFVTEALLISFVNLIELHIFVWASISKYLFDPLAVRITSMWPSLKPKLPIPVLLLSLWLIQIKSTKQKYVNLILLWFFLRYNLVQQWIVTIALSLWVSKLLCLPSGSRSHILADFSTLCIFCTLWASLCMCGVQSVWYISI